MTAHITIVGGNKGGVGKTTVARLLLDYVAAAANHWRVFDAQVPNGSLKRFYPDAELVDFASTAGRMRVLDGLDEQRPTLLDLSAGLLSETLQLLHDVGFLADVAAKRAELTVVHVLGPSMDSVGECADVAGRLAEGGTHVLLRNCANDEQFAWQPTTYKQVLSAVAPYAMVDVPHLDGYAREAVDAAGMGFSAFSFDTTKSLFLRRTVTKWQADCNGAFDTAKLRSAL